MTLSDETKEKARTICSKPFDQLPIAKDLPRLAKLISICNEEGNELPFIADPRAVTRPRGSTHGSEAQPLLNAAVSSADATPATFQTVDEAELHESLFVHVRRVLLTLSQALEGEEKAHKIHEALEAQRSNLNLFLPEILNPFFADVLGGDASPVLRVLKCCNQVPSSSSSSLSPFLLQSLFLLLLLVPLIDSGVALLCTQNATRTELCCLAVDRAQVRARRRKHHKGREQQLEADCCDWRLQSPNHQQEEGTLRRESFRT